MNNKNDVFYLLALNEEWFDNSSSIMKNFKDSSNLRKFVLKEEIFSDLDKKEWSDKNYEAHRVNILEKLLNEKYKLSFPENVSISPKKNVTSEELKVLKKNKLLGYILPHKGIINYKRFILFKTDEDETLVFGGESGINMLRLRIQMIDELKDIDLFLRCLESNPFVVVINRELYLSLRDKKLVDL
jgi:hypothetical protein